MLTNEEEQARKLRRELVEELLQLYPASSDRTIAKMVKQKFRNCSHTYVNQVRREMQRNKRG